MTGQQHSNLKRVMFIFILLSMLAPAAQQLFQFAVAQELKGSFHVAEKPELTWESWFDGSYGKQTEEYLNQNFGFRSDFVRLHNQLEFELFSATHPDYISIGKEGHLFAQSYVNAATGKDFVGLDSIQTSFQKLKMIQDTLEQLGTHFSLILCPGKASYDSEFLPDSVQWIDGPTNYETMVKTADEKHIRLIDLHQWTRNQRDTATHLLFPKTGVHWSNYHATLASDSIVRYMESFDSIEIPDPKWLGIRKSNTPEEGDDDLEQAMNLFTQFDHGELSYHNIEYPHNRDTTLRSLVIGDSYYFQMHPHHYRLYDHPEFWYYGKEARMVVPGQVLKVKDLDEKAQLQKQDFVFLLATEAQLHRLGWGWIHRTYKLYYPDGDL